MKFLIITTLVTLSYGQKYHDSSAKFIQEINDAQSSWTAGKNFHENTLITDIVANTGAWLSLPGDIERHDHVIDEDGKVIPKSFDVRENWAECKDIVDHIPDQSACQSAWAVASASVMSDRLCIHSKGAVKVQISAGNIISCCQMCGFQCVGGWVIGAWKHWQEHGIVSGGDFNTKKGCQDYPLPPCDHCGTDNTTACNADDYIDFMPACEQTCTADKSINYESDLTFGNDSYWIYPNASQVQLEIMTNGPVVGQFVVYPDFVNYKEGVYINTVNNSYTTHAVKIFGWGTDDAGIDYWLAANSWNPSWGDNGYFKILRGENHCGIEDQVIAGIPDLSSRMILT